MNKLGQKLNNEMNVEDRTETRINYFKYILNKLSPGIGMIPWTDAVNNLLWPVLVKRLHTR